jgi:hypothetical protein
MILRMSRKATAMSCFLVLGAALASPAQDSTAVIDRDVRLFVMSAALNLAGFDVEFGAPPRYHPARQALRDALADVDPDLVARLRAVYEAHRNGAPHEEQLAPYISLALNVGPPPAMTPRSDESEMPLDAREVEDILPLVRELYQSAGLSRLWGVLGQSYDSYLDRLAPPIRDTLVQTEAYLRLPTGGPVDRRAVVLVELSLPVNSVNVRNYPDDLFIVLGDTAAPPLDVIRHGYLHVLLDSRIAAFRDTDLSRASILAGLLDGVDGVRPEYAADFETMAAESLIHAIEVHLDEKDPDARREAIDAEYREGLLLEPFFDEELAEFESEGHGIREYLPLLFERLDPDAEAARFSERFFSIALSEAAPVRGEVPAPEPAPDPVRALLEEAQVAFNQGDDEAARSLFSRVLAEIDPDNGSALYGMALLASRDQDAVAAREYFTRTLTSASSGDAIRVWSHIYLGHIDDLLCQRASAVRHYQSALEIGNDTQGAQAAAREALALPFGNAC